MISKKCLAIVCLLLCSYNEGQAVDWCSSLGNIAKSVKSFSVTSLYGSQKTTSILDESDELNGFISGETLSRKNAPCSLLFQESTASKNEEFFSTPSPSQPPYDYFQTAMHPFSLDTFQVRLIDGLIRTSIIQTQINPFDYYRRPFYLGECANMDYICSYTQQNQKLYGNTYNSHSCSL